MSSEAIFTKEDINRLYAAQKGNNWSLRTIISIAIDHVNNKALVTTIRQSSIQKMITELDKPNRFNDTKHLFNFLYQKLRNYNAVVESSKEEEIYEY